MTIQEKYPINEQEYYPYDDLNDVAEPEEFQLHSNDTWNGAPINIDARDGKLGSGVLTAGGNYARILDIE